jgi:hypothetical protein
MNPLTGVIGEAWGMYRAHARHLLTIAFGIYVVAAVLEALLGFLGVVGALLAAIVSIVAAFLLQAALIKAVEDVRDGRVDLSIRETLDAARPFIARVAGASILAALGIGIGLVLLLVPGLFLLTIWCLIVPVIVLEGVGVGAAFGRSRELVRGHGWQVFGTIVVVFALFIVIGIVLGLVLAALPTAVRNLISGIVSGTLVAPFTALVLTLGYFRLRAAHGQPSPGPGYFGNA